MIDKTNSLNNRGDRQCIVFELEGEMYGISITKTESIERMMQITRVPDSTDYVLGIINLRGDILPILNLRKKMGLKPKAYDSDTRIIVIDAGNFRAGIVVDRVVEILSISEIGIQSAKEILTGRKSHLIDGIYKSGVNVIMIIDMDIVLGIELLNFDKEKEDAIVI